MNEVGLVLEGGGMRGLYTAGVLEYFLENDLFFPYVIGVSAGSCMAASYLSRQRGRNKKVNIGLAANPKYLSYRNLLTKKQLFGMDFLFDEIPNKLVPFDFETFLKGEEQFVVGTTDCHTGEPAYFNKTEHGDNILTVIRASSSLPLIAPAVPYDGKMLLDGGIIDPIPIKKAEKDGFHKNIVIMTKAEKVKEKKGSKLDTWVPKLYKRYPKISELLLNRSNVYRDTLAYIEEKRERGEVFILEPSVSLPVSRLERNQKRLIDLYELGYQDAKKQFDKLKKWMEE